MPSGRVGTNVRCRRSILALALVAVAAWTAGCLEGDLVGRPVPPFEVVTSEGARVNETTYLGRFVILDLMATWCVPCELEVQHLKEIQRQHGDKVVILSIGADPDESMADLDAFAREHDVTWPHALDRDSRVARAMGLTIIPKLVVIDPEGVVVLERQGEVLPAAITRVIDPSAAPTGGGASLVGPMMLALLLGFLAPFNPYRRFHRDGPAAWPFLAALAAFLLLALVAWRLAGLASTRATYGSLFGGILTLGALAWWWIRARRQEPEPPRPNAALEAADRMYEAAPHFAMILVLGLTGGGAASFFLPAAAFVAAAYAGNQARIRLPESTRVGAGLAGLALAGLGLAAFGARALAAMAP